MPNKNTSSRIKNVEQFEKLKEQGYSKQKAARIANTDKAGKNGGHAKSYEERTKKELMDKARQVGIKGRSKMSKDDLIHALRNN